MKTKIISENEGRIGMEKIGDQKPRKAPIFAVRALGLPMIVWQDGKVVEKPA